MKKFIKRILFLIVLLYLGINVYLIGNIALKSGRDDDSLIPISKEELIEYISSERKNMKFPISLKTKFGSEREISSLDLSDFDFSNVDFTAIKSIRNSNFNKANLSNAIFGNNNFHEINFAQANFKGVSGLNGRLNNCKFYCTKCDFSNADLQGVDLSYSNLEYANMHNANLSETNLSFVNFYNANLNGANFSNSILQAIKLNHADAREANFSGAKVDNVMFMLTELSDGQKSSLSKKSAITTGDDLEIAVKSGQDLSNFDFGGKFGGGIYNNLNLSNANFANAVSELNAEFKGTNLSHANLENIKQNSPNYSNANLTGANLKNSQIFYAKFDNTNFEGADLSGAKLGGDFTNVNFEGAILINTKFESNSIFSNTNFHNAQIEGIGIQGIKTIDGITGIPEESKNEIKHIQRRQNILEALSDGVGNLCLGLLVPVLVAACYFNGDCL